MDITIILASPTSHEKTSVNPRGLNYQLVLLTQVVAEMIDCISLLGRRGALDFQCLQKPTKLQVVQAERTLAIMARKGIVLES
jgi:hypothetical protein